jgi:hypothetical protein
MIRYLRPAAAFAALTLAGACSSKTNSGTPSAGGPAPISNGQCTSKSLSLLFTPMYSAFAPNHSFQVPVVVNGVDPATAGIVFSASDPSMVDIQQPDRTTGIAMLTTRKAGTVEIIAAAGGLCGSSTLTITAATEADWSVGNTRYNNMMAITGPGGLRQPRDAGPADFACTNCHGDTATAATAPFRTVSHTPEQTAGFSDEDLVNIFKNGMVPKGGYFDTTIVPQNVWSGFHHWSVTDEEAKGLVVYLRALTPASQNGMRGDFGGMRVRPDGGFGRRRDGGDNGGPPPPGTDSPVDAAAASD